MQRFFCKIKIFDYNWNVKNFINLFILMKKKSPEDIYDELVLEWRKQQTIEDLKETLEYESLSSWFYNIVKAILSIAPQTVDKEKNVPNYYISGSLAMNLLPSIDKITLSDWQVIDFDDNIRKAFEKCYRKIEDLDLISTDNSISPHEIAMNNCKRTINWLTIERKLLDLGLPKDIVDNIVKSCIKLKRALILDSSMDEQKVKDFHYCKATIKGQDWNFDVFITDPLYLLWYKFAARLKAENDKDKSDFVNLYKWLSIIYWEEELKSICMKYNELRPDLYN